MSLFYIEKDSVQVKIRAHAFQLSVVPSDNFLPSGFFYTVRNLGSTTECDGCVVLACFEKNLVFYCKIGRKML